METDQNQRRRRVLLGVLVGCGVLLVLGVLLIVALLVGIGIGMSGNSKGEVTDEGAKTNTPEEKVGGDEYIPLVLRISGEQGTPYQCTHKDMSDEGEVVFEEEEGELGSRPVQYKARILDTGISDPYSNFSAECVIPDPGRGGRLKAEVLVDGQVVASEETRPDPPGQKVVGSNRLTVTYGPYASNEGSSKGKKK